MADKACRICRRIVKGNLCLVCKSNDITASWRGILVVLNPESEIAKEAGLTASGKYAVKVK